MCGNMYPHAVHIALLDNGSYFVLSWGLTVKNMAVKADVLNIGGVKLIFSLL